MIKFVLDKLLHILPYSWILGSGWYFNKRKNHKRHTHKHTLTRAHHTCKKYCKIATDIQIHKTDAHKTQICLKIIMVSLH